jgi:S1-C subfamily serine protease
VKNKIIFFFLLLFLGHCGTQVPTERKVTKTETITGETKKIYLTENSIKIDEKIITKKYTNGKSKSYDVKIREHFQVPEVLVREDIERIYVTKKKKGTMIHNPLGEATGSIFAFGMIEAWCLTEWLATALPGKQKNIYLSKCKERYIGSKKKTTEDTIKKSIIKTGKIKNRYQDKDTTYIEYNFLNIPNKKYKIKKTQKPVCDKNLMLIFDCGSVFTINSKNVLKNYFKITDQKNIGYPIKIEIKTEKLIKIISLSKIDLLDDVNTVISEIKEEKELRLAKIKEEEEAKQKELELKERYKPVAAWNGSAFFVSASGHIITNNHVVEDTSITDISSKCDTVNVFLKNQKYEAQIISQDSQNDLALLKIKDELIIKNFATFRSNGPILGEKITALGFPFGKSISSQIKLTSGNVSSLSGLGDEFTRMQIDAALQPGNSGGPIYDKSGNVIGVAVAKASIFFFLEAFGTLPENMNFGIKSSVVKTFLESNSVNFKIGNSKLDVGTEKVAEIGSSHTLYLECMIRKDKLAKIEKIKNSRKSN